MLSILSSSLAVALGVPVATFASEVLLGLKVPRPRVGTNHEAGANPGPRKKLTVVIPAHDERLLIEGTIEHLRKRLSPGDRLLVVADNCSDDTAERARAAGAEVLERQDPSRRGKGYAISFALAHLAESEPPDVVVIVDADCEISAGSIADLRDAVMASGRPVQARYLMRQPRGSGARAAVSAFAFLVKNQVRPLGLSRLGFPCQLTGTGMAFPWHALKNASPTEGHITEDLVLGLDLAVRGYPPSYCHHVLVESDAGATEHAAFEQRKRWESGHLTTLVQQVPRLLAAGVLKRRPDLIALGLDLAVPPLSSLVMLTGAAAIPAVVAWSTGSTFALGLVGAELGALCLAVGAAWWIHGRDTLSPAQALSIPGYALRKVPMYLGLVQKGGPKEWVRTERSANDS